MAIPVRPARGRKTIKRGAGKRIVEGKSFRLADKVRYIQRRAADYDSSIVTIAQLILFSTKTGDAWLLDPADQSAARLAREGESEPIHIEETDTTFAIGWKGRYRIVGPAFIYADEDTGRVATILGYPTDKLTPGGLIGKFQICLASLDLTRVISPGKGNPDDLRRPRALHAEKFQRVYGRPVCLARSSAGEAWDGAAPVLGFPG